MAYKAPASCDDDLAQKARKARDWSQTLQTESARVAGLVAETEDMVADTLHRLAHMRPRHASELDAQGEEAANFAAYVRRRLQSRAAMAEPDDARWIPGEAGAGAPASSAASKSAD